MTEPPRPKWAESRIAPAIHKRMENRNAEAAKLLRERGHVVLTPDQRDEALRIIANTIGKIRQIRHELSEWHPYVAAFEDAVSDAFGVPRGTLSNYADLDGDD